MIAARAIGFGGRILPDIEQKLATAGKHVAKYLEQPRDAFVSQADRAVRVGPGSRGQPQGGLGGGGRGLYRRHRRSSGWVWQRGGHAGNGPWEKIICGHCGGCPTGWCWCTTPTPAGQYAADRALEFFLGSELDLRVLTLPANLDPCDYLLEEGADAFRAHGRAGRRPAGVFAGPGGGRISTLNSAEGSRRAAEWILGLMSHVPATHHLGLEVKQAKVLDTLSHRLRVPLDTLEQAAPPVAAAGREAQATAEAAASQRQRSGPRQSTLATRRDPAERARPDRSGAASRSRLSEPETVTWLCGGG